MKFTTIKISPCQMRKEILSEFPEIKEHKDNKKIVFIPNYLFKEFSLFYTNLRNLDLLNNMNRNLLYPKTIEEKLIGCRGDFNVETNAYRLNQVLNKDIFDESRRKGYLFSIRFQTEFEFELKGKHTLIWYIREDISFIK